MISAAGMTLVARLGVIGISVHFVMVFIGFGSTVLMTIQAGEAAGVSPGVALRAGEVVLAAEGK